MNNSRNPKLWLIRHFIILKKTYSKNILPKNVSFKIDNYIRILPELATFFYQALMRYRCTFNSFIDQWNAKWNHHRGVILL